MDIAQRVSAKRVKRTHARHPVLFLQFRQVGPKFLHSILENKL